MLPSKTSPQLAGGFSRRRLTGWHGPSTQTVDAPRRPVAALPELFSQIDPSALQIPSNVINLPADLPPHFGTRAFVSQANQLISGVQELFESGPVTQQLVSQVQGLFDSVPVTQQLQTSLGGAMSSVDALWQQGDAAGVVNQTAATLDQQRASLLVQLEQLGGVVASHGAAEPLTGAVTAAQEQLAAVLQPGQLQPHWGTLAAQDTLRTVASNLPLNVQGALDLALDWPTLMDTALSGVATSAVQLAGDVSGMHPDAALMAVTQQLDQVVQALAKMPQGFITTPTLDGVISDLGLVLAALPTYDLTSAAATSAAALPEWLRLQQLAAGDVPAAVARLADRLVAASQQSTWAGHSLPELMLASAGMAVVVGWSAKVAPAAGEIKDLQEAERELGYEYDPVLLNQYIARRPISVMKRTAQVAAEMIAFGLPLAVDFATGRLKENEPKRAEQLRFAIERLGPAYVKVAQAISTRVDLLTPQYFMQIQMLQDRVPPFPCEEARDAMVQAMGRPLEQVFTEISERPVAAASLGQVYRATLVPELGGDDVAVKVQRPGVLSSVALDLALMRSVAQGTSANMNSDWVAIIDNWAVRFFHEMDYVREADNAERFEADMAQVQGITVPTVIRTLSTHSVLTSKWIDGEKLCESSAPDVRELCNTLLTAYLIQLLDTGFLHADPHPGNLLRTPDGRIAVLDYGLMTEVTEEQRWALLEYIGHLSTRDWEAVARDLKTLGFIPPEVDPGEKGLVEPLGKIMSQLVGGGGATKLNIDKVVVELEELGKSYPFQVPAFFALILRAFSVIEGVGLGADPDYAIVAECFPYMTRRLLADDSPRARALLRDILYGGRQRLDVQRLIQFADGFSAYTTDGLMQREGSPEPVSNSTTTTASSSASPRQMLVPSLPPSGSQRTTSTTSTTTRSTGKSKFDGAMKEVLLTVFSPQGNYVQELLVEEAAAAVDALSVAAVATLLMSLAGLPINGTNSTNSTNPVPSLSMMMPSGWDVPMQMMLPVPLLPPAAVAWLQPLVQLTEEDREALAVVQGVMELFRRAAGGSATAGRPGAAVGAAGGSSAAVAMDLRALISEVGPLLPEVAPGLAMTWQRFMMALVQRAQARLERGMKGFGSGEDGVGNNGGNGSSSNNGAGTATQYTGRGADGNIRRGDGYYSDGGAAAGGTGRSGGSSRSSWGDADRLLGGGARIDATANSRWARSPRS